VSLKTVINAVHSLTESKKTAFKDAVHSTLTSQGFDGNGRFESHSAGIAKLHDALHHHGLTIIDHVTAPTGSTASGQHTLQLGYLHPEGKEDPKPSDAHVHVQWTNLTSHPDDIGPHGDMPTKNKPRFEFLAYVPGKLPAPGEAPKATLRPAGTNEAKADQCSMCKKPATHEVVTYVQKGGERVRGSSKAYCASHKPHPDHVNPSDEIHEIGNYAFVAHESAKPPVSESFDVPHYEGKKKVAITTFGKRLNGASGDQGSITGDYTHSELKSFHANGAKKSDYPTTLHRYSFPEASPPGGKHVHFAGLSESAVAPTANIEIGHRVVHANCKGASYGKGVVQYVTHTGDGVATKYKVRQDDGGIKHWDACNTLREDAVPAVVKQPLVGVQRADRKDFTAANKFRITAEALDGAGVDMKIHSPAGKHIGGVHRGQMFLKRTAMAERDGAAKAWREYQAKTGHTGQDATFDGVHEAIVAVGQGAQGIHHKTLSKIHALAAKHGGTHDGFGPRGIHFKFKDGGHGELFRDDVGRSTGGTVRTGHVKECLNIAKVRAADPDTARLVEWTVLSSDALSMTLQHPSNGLAYRFPLTSIDG